MSTRNSHLATLGLVRNPFPYTPDAGSYFLTAHLEEQFVELAHCIESRKGFCLLTAEVGMGKSTLVRRLMAELQSKNVVSALVFNTFLQGQELLAAILQDFGLESAGTMSADIAALNQFLLDHHREGKTCLLIIDDAQNLSASSLELIRLLCNLETDQEKLLQILLAGQPELEEMLSQHSMRQLRSRVAKHSRLHGLNSTEIADYVKFRFDSAGNNGTLVLQADACQLLWKETQGVPRQIHVILDRCLYGLAAKNGNVIDLPLMRKAIEDSRVDLGPTTGVAAPVTAPVTATPRGVPMAWIGSGLALAGVVAAVVLFNGRAVAPVASAAVPAVAVAGQSASAQSLPAPATEPVAALPAPAEKSAVATPPAADRPVGAGCTPKVAWPSERKAVSQPLSELTQRLLGERLARLDDACTELRQGQTWLTWGAVPAGYAMDQRLAAAQIQIALSHYGSLLPQAVDGVWGAKSQRALQQFQTGVGLEPTGNVDALSGLILERFYVQER
jgi:type II secretory pathway predicted ATPase ExeA